jgi:hypothetical protein
MSEEEMQERAPTIASETAETVSEASPIGSSDSREEGVSILATVEAEAAQQWKEDLERQMLTMKEKEKELKELIEAQKTVLQRAGQENAAWKTKMKIEEEDLKRTLARVENEHFARLAGHADAIAMTRIKAANIASRHAAVKNCGNWALEMADGGWELRVGSGVEEAPPRRIVEEGFVEYIPWTRSGVDGGWFLYLILYSILMYIYRI